LVQAGAVVGLLWLAGWLEMVAQVPVVSQTNVTFRVMAANLNGNLQSYQPFALRILQGLQPDVLAIQEFNYGNNTSNDFRAMLDGTLGTNYVWFRESGYSIPNGIISRWPIVASGSWEDVDVGVNDRGFAWAQIKLPSGHTLFVVSVHLKASTGSDNVTRRAAEAASVKELIRTNSPAGAFVIVAGDFNLHSPTEGALNTFKTFLSDSPIPTDAATSGDPDTNQGRDERYDYVLPDFSLATNLVPVVLGGRVFPDGLVFDSRKWFIEQLNALHANLQPADSGLAQHMAVAKDFRVSWSVTNLLPVSPPILSLSRDQVVRWTGLGNLAYTIQASTNLARTNWFWIGTATSTGTSFSFTNAGGGTRFYRVTFP
jgi:endonuclease/exonuclease/phosphatase family metal-dependent hydrolase